MIQKSTPARNEAGTPAALFRVLHEEYKFTVDVCASPHNAKLPGYWSVEDNGLAMPWEGHRVWCNPPYRDITPWVNRGPEAELAVFLLPSRTDRFWWMRWKPLVECHYFVGEKPERRIQFVRPPGVPPEEWKSNSMSNVLFVVGAEAIPGKEVWRSGIDGRRL